MWFLSHPPPPGIQLVDKSCYSYLLWWFSPLYVIPKPSPPPRIQLVDKSCYSYLLWRFSPLYVIPKPYPPPPGIQLVDKSCYSYLFWWFSPLYVIPKPFLYLCYLFLMYSKVSLEKKKRRNRNTTTESPLSCVPQKAGPENHWQIWCYTQGNYATQESSGMCHLMPQWHLLEWREEDERGFVHCGRSGLLYKYWLLMRRMVENYCPEVKLNPGLLFTEAVNSRPGLSFTEGTIISTIPWIKEQSVFVLYTPFIDFLVCTEPENLESRLASSKFGSCDSFFEIRGNSKN